MKKEVDFSKYSLEELYESAKSIDRDKYPERTKIIDALIREKQSHLPERIPGRFYYTKNYLNLINVYLFLSVVVLILYSLYTGSVPATPIPLLEYGFYASSITLLLAGAYKYLKSYVKLYEHKRFIQIDENTVVMPEHSNSLKYVEFSVSEINDLYYRLERRAGVVTDLIIIYDYDKNASVTTGYLPEQDFDAVCVLLKKAADLAEIGERYT